MMKIDYELAKEIGATHYHDRTGEMYKVDLGSLLVFRRDCWFHSGLPLGEVVSKIKPIPPKRNRTEYEKVTESIFDLRDEFERGWLYGDNAGDTKIETLAHLGACCQTGSVFKKVEKEIDERQEFVKEASKIWNGDGMHCSTDIFREMYDSGKFKFIG